MKNIKHVLFLHLALSLYLMPQIGNMPTDWAEDRLKGKVRTVYMESAKLIPKDGKVVEEGRKPNNEITYSPEGQRVKALRYDWMGNLSETTTYRIIEGDRTLKSEFIRHPYNPPPPMPAPPQPNAPKWDDRYNVRHKRMFDAKGRLVEMTILLGNGEMTYRMHYQYEAKPGYVEEETYNSKGKLEWKTLRKLDAKGNVVESTSLDAQGKIRYAETYSHEFDKNGNWTKRTTSSLEGKDLTKQPVPTNVEYRKIQYY